MRVASIAVLVTVLSAPAFADTTQLREAANAAALEGDAATAKARFEEILALEPEDGAIHYRLATLLMDHGGASEEVEKHFLRAGELGFQPLGVAYRLSRLYARTDRREEALERIEAMAAGGFTLVNLIEGEDDYDSVKNDARFVAALESMRAARYPCQADQRHHAFDFWIGEWTVTQYGQFAGTNTIKPILGHCALFENWTSASGAQGKSFNYYDPGKDHWRQIWISDSGTFIEFVGEARDGGIYYTAETANPADGSITHHKFEFSRNKDGSVRQFWQTSTDGRKTWNTSWDGHYERVETQ
ncbi:MAG: hypothetical protein QNJ40_26640 [Xanthomonadales bacterium]|nr:hypothetical protein [Xanthomonadales bacterium]